MPRVLLKPAKTFVSEEYMISYIKKSGLAEYRYFVAYNKEGRCFPVFIIGFDRLDTNPLALQQRGFCVVG